MGDLESTKERLNLFRKIVESLILLYDPLSATPLSTLLGTLILDIGTLITPLWSVLNVPEKAGGTPTALGTIKLFHLSFRDFLVDHNLVADDKGEKLWIEEAQAHEQLTSHCLRLLRNYTLLENVRSVKALEMRRATVSQTTIANNLPDEVAYACSYWVQHTVMSGEYLKDDGDVHRFLKVDLLHGIETLSWLGKTLM